VVNRVNAAELPRSNLNRVVAYLDQNRQSAQATGECRNVIARISHVTKTNSFDPGSQ
jgi:hypothetical protein